MISQLRMADALMAFALAVLFLIKGEAHAAPKVGDSVWSVVVKIYPQPKGAIILAEKVKYEKTHSDAEFRSGSKTDWSLRLKDSNGSVVETVFLKLKKNVVLHPSGHHSAKRGSKLGPYDLAIVVLPAVSGSAVIELLFKDEVRAKKVVQ